MGELWGIKKKDGTINQTVVDQDKELRLWGDSIRRDAAEVVPVTIVETAELEALRERDKAAQSIYANVKGCWTAFEWELRESTGNTNYQVVLDFLAAYEATLSRSPSPERP